MTSRPHQHAPEFTNAINAIRAQWGLWFFFCEWRRLGRPDLFGPDGELSFMGDDVLFNIRLLK